MSIVNKLILVTAGIGIATISESILIQTIIAFGLILIFGIPHGATDHILNNLIEKGKLDQKPQIKFLGYYFGVILLYAVLWFFLPSISLLLFLIISAYHFGETQLIKLEGKEFIKMTTYFFWGANVLLLIFYPHLEEVSNLISPHLVGEEVMSFVSTNYYLILAINAIGLISALAVLNLKSIPGQFIELAMIFLLANFSSLLLSFAVFFAFWHSRDATFLQIQKIDHILKDFTFKKWLKLALPYSIVSVIGISLIILISNYLDFHIPLVTLFFILVALITMPHVFVMASFYRLKER